MSYDEEDWNRPVMGSGARDTVRERRSTIENNDGVVDRTTYPIQYSSETYKGKFFTRGCRGMLESIQVYCDGDAADTLTLRYSPHPCIGPIGAVSIIPADGYAWQDFPIEEMWNYDSLFIWIHACTANITWGYDAGLPYDGHESADIGATWSDLAIRPFIRAVLTGETPGDVPVSGIINNIPLPYASSEQEELQVQVPEDTLTDLVDIHGAGYCDYIEMKVYEAFQSDLTWCRVYCDEVLAGRWMYANLSLYGHTTSTPTVSLSTFADEGICYMLIHKRFEFRRRLRIAAINTLGPVVVDVWVYPTLLR